MLTNKKLIFSLLEILFLFFLLLSQVYIYSSGSPQPAHWIGLVLAISILWVNTGRYPVKSDAAFLLVMFSIYSAFINTTWSLWYKDFIFLIDNIYIAYNLLIFISLLVLMRRWHSFNQIIVFSCAISLSFLVTSWLLGYGRYNFGLRYTGFFNDPNQMAFWVLCVSAICILLSKSQVTRVVGLFLAVFLVALTLSRSGLLGIVPLILGGLLMILSWYSLQKKLVMLAVIPVSIVVLAYFGYFEFLIPLIDRFQTTDFAAHGDLRGYARILNYPEYLFFGAGKGLDWRFGTNLEIHSTWAALLFYYGVVGLGLVLFALYKIASRLTVAEKLLFLAPLAYGFATYGFRTPIFWVFLAVFAHVSLSRRRFGPSAVKVEESLGTLISEPYPGKSN